MREVSGLEKAKTAGYTIDRSVTLRANGKVKDTDLEVELRIYSTKYPRINHFHGMQILQFGRRLSEQNQDIRGPSSVITDTANSMSTLINWVRF